MTVKKCKGNDKVDKFEGCGKPSENRTYGLCPKCLYKWSTETEKGKAWFKKRTAWKMKKNEKEKRKEERQKTRELRDKFNSKDAMNLADIYFSRYIRLKHSFKHGGKRFVNCFTCSGVIPIKQSDNGHFIKREHKAVRYDENNCRPQCKTCNGDIKHNGKQADFRRELVNEIGEDAVLELERKSRETIKADGYFYRAIATKYRVKVNEIQNEIGKIFK